MKKLTGIVAIVLTLLLMFGVTVAFASEGKGDDQPDVGYRVIDTNCGLAQYGFTSTWWWATYSNGTGVLKCIGNTASPPPVETVIPIPACATPGGTSFNAFLRVFPDGQVHLVCKL